MPTCNPSLPRKAQEFLKVIKVRSLVVLRPHYIPYFKENFLGQIPIAQHMLAKLDLFQSIKKFESIQGRNLALMSIYYLTSIYCILKNLIVTMALLRRYYFLFQTRKTDLFIFYYLSIVLKY